MSQANQTPSEAVRIVVAAVERWGRKGAEPVLADATPDCEIDLSRARGPYAGVYGLDDAVSLHEAFLDHWGTRDLALGEPLAAGDSVVVPFTDRFSGRQGVEVEATGVWVGTVRDGALARLCLYQDLDEALEAVGRSG